MSLTAKARTAIALAYVAWKEEKDAVAYLLEQAAEYGLTHVLHDVEL